MTTLGANSSIDLLTRVDDIQSQVFPTSTPSTTPSVVQLAPSSSTAIQSVASPLQASLVIGPQQEGVTNLSGSTDALPLDGSVYISSSGVDATTLATPTAGAPGTGDDGKILKVTDVGGHAHTITTASNKVVPSHHILTFDGTAGSFVILQAFNGLWYIKGSSGVTPS